MKRGRERENEMEISGCRFELGVWVREGTSLFLTHSYNLFLEGEVICKVAALMIAT